MARRSSTLLEEEDRSPTWGDNDRVGLESTEILRLEPRGRGVEEDV
jgi:hypothetical protein